MADSEDLALVRSGSKDLAKIDLRNADLSGHDFFNADLTGAKLNRCRFNNANLVAANLRGASIVQADFSGSDLRGAKLPLVAISVKFRNAILTGTRVLLNGNKIDFSGADLVGADFTGSKFEADVLFDNVQTDQNTNFEGVEMLRATSRYPAFSDYDYQQGKLVRRKNAEPASPLSLKAETGAFEVGPSTGVTIEVPTDHIPMPITSVRTRLGIDPTTSAEMARALSRLLLEEIVALQSQKPNDAAALAKHERYSEFLASLSVGLARLAELVDSEARQPSKPEVAYLEASGLIVDLQAKLNDWYQKNSEIVADTGRIGAMGASTWFLTLCGAPAAGAFAAGAAVYGGAKIAGYVKSILNK